MKFFNRNKLLVARRRGKVEIWQYGKKLSDIPGTDIKRGYEFEALVVDDNNQLVYTGGVENSIVIWSWAKEKTEAILEDSQGQVMSLALSSNGRYLASGGDDAAIRIWDLNPESGARRRPVRGLEAKMNCRGLKFGGAIGLQRVVNERDMGVGLLGQTLGDFFAERGAVAGERKQAARQARKSAKKAGPGRATAKKTAARKSAAKKMGARKSAKRAGAARGTAKKAGARKSANSRAAKGKVAGPLAGKGSVKSAAKKGRARKRS